MRIVATSHVWRVIISVVLVLAGALFLLPVLWVVVESLEPQSEQFLLPPVWFPTHMTLDSYRTLVLGRTVPVEHHQLGDRHRPPWLSGRRS